MQKSERGSVEPAAAAPSLCPARMHMMSHTPTRNVVAPRHLSRHHRSPRTVLMYAGGGGEALGVGVADGGVQNVLTPLTQPIYAVVE